MSIQDGSLTHTILSVLCERYTSEPDPVEEVHWPALAINIVEERVGKHFSYNFTPSIKRLLKRGWISETFRRHPQHGRIQRVFSITPEGLREQGYSPEDVPGDIAPAIYQRPNISQGSIDQAKDLIADALNIIVRSNLSQEQSSQIYGLLKICEQALDLPTPQPNLVKRILNWLRTVNEISDLVDQIWERLFG